MPIVVVEVDHVVADEEDRDADRAQLAIEVGAQRLAAHRVAPDAHVRDEERHERVEIARIRRDGVAVRELPDLVSYNFV